jgi:hypothetical protein
MLQAVIQMLTPKETIEHRTESDSSNRMIPNLNGLTGEFRMNGHELLSFTVKDTTFEYTTFRSLGGGIHEITRYGYVTPAGGNPMKVYPGDRFYITWGGEFHRLPPVGK